LMGIEAVLSKSAAKPLIKGKDRSITKEILKMYMNRDNWTLDNSTQN
jgi:hypothetical protein